MEDEEEDPLEASLQKWREKCVLAQFPHRCPKCEAKIKLFHINAQGEAVQMCPNDQVSNYCKIAFKLMRAIMVRLHGKRKQKWRKSYTKVK